MSNIISSISISDFIGWIVGIAGLLYALYANKEAKKVRDISRSDAWNLYQITNVTCGKIQDAFKMYKNTHTDNSKIEVVEELSKADALSWQAYLAAIRHIQMVEPKFDMPIINYWVNTKKVPEHQENDFRKFVVDKDKDIKISAANNAN